MWHHQTLTPLFSIAELSNTTEKYKTEKNVVNIKQPGTRLAARASEKNLKSISALNVPKEENSQHI